MSSIQLSESIDFNPTHVYEYLERLLSVKDTPAYLKNALTYPDAGLCPNLYNKLKVPYVKGLLSKEALRGYKYYCNSFAVIGVTSDMLIRGNELYQFDNYLLSDVESLTEEKELASYALGLKSNLVDHTFHWLWSKDSPYGERRWELIRYLRDNFDGSKLSIPEIKVIIK